MAFMLVTFDVSQLDRSRLVRALQVLNMLIMLMALEVSSRSRPFIVVSLVNASPDEKSTEENAKHEISFA